MIFDLLLKYLNIIRCDTKNANAVIKYKSFSVTTLLRQSIHVRFISSLKLFFNTF